MNKRVDIDASLVSRLSHIQKTLNAPKGQFNSFGKYHYRSCEDILMAVKPLLDDLVLTVNDEIVSVGDRIYVKATASITDGKESISTSAFAREAETKKGMDDAQVTGSTSSYARKYALNGLLLIDDNKDADSTNKHGKEGEEAAPKTPAERMAASASAKGVTPTAGADEALTAAERASIEQFAQGIQVHFDAGMPVEKIAEALHEEDYNTEQKVYCWSLLDSKIRSAIKKHQSKPTAAELSAQA